MSRHANLLKHCCIACAVLQGVYHHWIIGLPFIVSRWNVWYCPTRSITDGSFSLFSAPCPPHNVSANVQCDSGSVLVSWSPAVDASQFRVEIESQSTGVISSCNSTNTQCSIAHLPCGESFNISVVALRGSCQSQASSGFNIASGWTLTLECSQLQMDGWIDRYLSISILSCTLYALYV